LLRHRQWPAVFHGGDAVAPLKDTGNGDIALLEAIPEL
jgi:hypothetical protein